MGFGARGQREECVSSGLGLNLGSISSSLCVPGHLISSLRAGLLSLLYRIQYSSAHQWFSTGTILAPQETLGSVWRHSWLSQLGCLSVCVHVCACVCTRARVARVQEVQHPTVHKITPHDKESVGPECQQCQGWEILTHVSTRGRAVTQQIFSPSPFYFDL